MKTIVASLTLIAALTAASAFAAPLSLENYLQQVNQNSPGIKSYRAGAEGHALLKEIGGVSHAPYLFANTNWLDDKKESPNPSFTGNHTQASRYSVGLGIDSPIGLDLRYSYNQGHTEIIGALPTVVTLPNSYTTFNRIELTQHLFANGFGARTRAEAELLEAAHLAQEYANRFQLQTALAEAEATYWRLALARQSVDIQDEVSARAKRVLDWAKRRVGLQLGNRSDLLQAQAAYDLRRMELMTAQEEARNAARQFNLLRNREGTQVDEEVQLPSIEAILRMLPEGEETTRLDVKAAEAKERAAIAEATVDRETVKPTLDLVVDYAWNGLDGQRGPAVSESFRNTYPTRSIGVVFRTPLAFGSLLDSLKGNRLTQDAATYELERVRVTATKDKAELESRLQEARSRLSLLRTIENVQKDKVDNEQNLLTRGRTTTYQALTFEQDYATSQLLRLRTQQELLGIVSQLRLFRGEQ